MIFASPSKMRKAWAEAHYRARCSILKRRLELGILDVDTFCEGVVLAKEERKRHIEEAEYLQNKEGEDDDS